MSDEEPKYHVHLILEGNEEEAFFSIVKEMGVNPKIELTWKNAGGAQRIAAQYQDAISEEEFDSVLCVYDVDYKMHDDKSSFSITQSQLTQVAGSKEAVDLISYCTNPNILLWFLIGKDTYDNVFEIDSVKGKNTELLHKYFPAIGNNSGNKPFKKYDASAWQLREFINSYIYDETSYEQLISNALEIPMILNNDVPSSNVLELLKALKDGDIKFFENINKKIDW